MKNNNIIIILKIVIITLIAFFISLVIFQFYESIYKPATWSYDLACVEGSKDKLNKEGIIALAGVSFSPNQTLKTIEDYKNAKLTVTYNEKYAELISKETIKHENCHINQIKRGRFFKCSNKVFAF